MKLIASFLTFAASAALIFPLTFTSAANGCADPNYVYNTSSWNDKAPEAAKLAKHGFCSAVKIAQLAQ